MFYDPLLPQHFAKFKVRDLAIHRVRLVCGCSGLAGGILLAHWPRDEAGEEGLDMASWLGLRLCCRRACGQVL